MRTYLLLAVGLALSSCSTTKPKPAPVAQSEPTGEAAPGNATQNPAALPVMGVKKGIIARLLSHSKLETPLSGGVAPRTNATQVPRKCKGCTFNTVAGDQTNAAKKATVQAEGATNVGKAKAPVATGEARATDQSGTGAASTIEGNGNAPVLTNTAPPKRSWQEALADNLSGPLGWVVGLVALAGVGYGIYYFWFLIPRRKASTDTPTV